MTEPTQGAGTLAERLEASRVDLLAYIEEGIPARAWLPASEAFIARGGRIHISAPMKSGKSLSLLVHAVNMVTKGARVAILDRENGADEYARRLRDILEDRPPETRELIRTRLAYYAWPEVRLEDGAALAHEFSRADAVIIDSTRTFLSGLGLAEDGSDDFARFSVALILPLMQAGVATVQLDNTGHEGTRARGTSTKGDLADCVFQIKTTKPFDQALHGEVEVRRKHSRFGDVAAAFTMELGAGRYGRFEISEDAATATTSSTFRPTVYMERISMALEEHPGLSKRAIREAVKGTKHETKDLALELLIADGYVSTETDGQTLKHHSVKPYREDTDPDRAPRAQPCPDRAGHGGGGTVPTVPPSKGHGGTGTVNGHGACAIWDEVV